MPAISIRGLDDKVVDRLRRRAKRHKRSLESEIRAILEQEAEHDQRLNAAKRIRKIAKKLTPAFKGVNTLELLREIRGYGPDRP
ncbi:MAG: Arc family DNA-binding protein [Planctomycetes bacterium]|nr:Arc family DNA-binding protein [Planctomycetota bacterium]NUQ35676.1 Arc family DNA-binding protein [Planctomycetaceae bacterium]